MKLPLFNGYGGEPYKGLPEDRFKFLKHELVEGVGLYDLEARLYDPTLGRFAQIDPLIEDGQHSYTPYHYSFNNPIRFSDPTGLMACCGDGADGIGNGMTLTENIYWSTRDALVSSVATVSTFVGSFFSDNVKTQRVNANYSNGNRTLSSEVVPKGEVAGEVGGSLLTLASANPSLGSSGSGLFLAKTSPKASVISGVVETTKKIIKADPNDINFSQRTINKNFDTPNGKKPINSAINEGPKQVESFPPISGSIVKGQMVARDGNSRLFIARKTKAKTIDFEVENSIELFRDLFKRTDANGLPKTGTNKLPKY